MARIKHEKVGLSPFFHSGVPARPNDALLTMPLCTVPNRAVGKFWAVLYHAGSSAWNPMNSW